MTPRQLQILLVEDDPRFQRLAADFLRGEGMEVVGALDGVRGLQCARAQRFDVALLDIMLPGLDGLELCRRIREHSDIPILFVTARGDEEDRILGLETGADDYLVKPFGLREMLARVRALARRANGDLKSSTTTLRVGGLLLDPSSQQASLNGRVLALTSYEFALLRFLAERPGRVLSREQLMDGVKGTSEESFDRAIDVHICHLRLKLGDSYRTQKLLRTVRGAGYQLVEPETSL